MFGMGNMQPQMSAVPTQPPMGFMGMTTPIIPQSQATQMSQPPLLMEQPSQPVAPSKPAATPSKSTMNGLQVQREPCYNF